MIGEKVGGKKIEKKENMTYGVFSYVWLERKWEENGRISWLLETKI